MKVLITGGTGFLGQQVDKYANFAGWETFPVGKADADLLDYSETQRLMQSVSPDAVIHLAASCGGINKNASMPATILSENCIINANVFRAFGKSTTYLVCAGSVCAYPATPPVPFLEQSLWTGKPHYSNFPYGASKLILEAFIEAYESQYRWKSAVLHLANLYGAGEDTSDDGHVVGGIIRKVYDAKMKAEPDVALWGTGKCTRDFLHVTDAARAFVAAVKAKASGVFNIGTGIETPINRVATLASKHLEYDGDIVWNCQKPDGQPRRCVSYAKAEMAFGYQPRISFDEGIKDEVKWFLSERAK